MKRNLITKNTSRIATLASVIAFGFAGAAYAAGAGDQVQPHGDMSGHGGPVDRPTAGQSGQTGGAGQGADRRYDKDRYDTDRTGQGGAGGSMGQGSGQGGSGGSMGQGSGQGGGSMREGGGAGTSGGTGQGGY